MKAASAFATATRAPGGYRANLQLLSGQQQVCTSQANFDIVSSAVQGTALAGSISTDPGTVQRPGDANLNYQVNNIGNVDLASLQLKVLLVDVTSGNAVQTLTDQTALSQGQSFRNTKVINSGTVPGGDYLVVLQGESGGATQTIGSAPLRIITSTFHLDAAGYTVAEGCGAATITVTRTGDTSAAAAIEFSTTDLTALQRTDYSLAVGRLSFAAGETSKTFNVLVNEDAYVEGAETLSVGLSNPSNGGSIGPESVATLTIIDNDSASGTNNPIDDSGTFVCQHYHDFLAREADPGGAAYWTDRLTECGSDPLCLNDRRVAVSDAFFYELEFQRTGAYVFRVYRAAFGNNQPFANPDFQIDPEARKLPSYAVFMRDRARVIESANLAQSQLDFANAFVQRAEFISIYPLSLDAGGFVDAILATIKNSSGADLSAQRDSLIALCQSGGRGAVVYRLADDAAQSNPINNRSFIDAEYNRAFVFTEYAGYLRRDSDIGGFLFWLGKVNEFAVRDFGIQHTMACAFITSEEYQTRFGSTVTRRNADCQR